MVCDYIWTNSNIAIVDAIDNNMLYAIHVLFISHTLRHARTHARTHAIQYTYAIYKVLLSRNIQPHTIPLSFSFIHCSIQLCRFSSDSRRLAIDCSVWNVCSKSASWRPTLVSRLHWSVVGCPRTQPRSDERYNSRPTKQRVFVVFISETG